MSDFLVSDVIDAAYGIVATEYEDKGINFSITQGKCNCHFIGYERELIQVLINILNNAKDILLQESIENPKVVITLMKTDNDVLIILHDNAGGIPESIIQKVFDPYFTTKHESVGTGIGLYMSKKIITEHFNGTLSVVNEESGAKFTISLPRQDT